MGVGDPRMPAVLLLPPPHAPPIMDVIAIGKNLVYTHWAFGVFKNDAVKVNQAKLLLNNYSKLRN